MKTTTQRTDPRIPNTAPINASPPEVLIYQTNSTPHLLLEEVDSLKGQHSLSNLNLPRQSIICFLHQPNSLNLGSQRFVKRLTSTNLKFSDGTRKSTARKHILQERTKFTELHSLIPH